MIIKIKSNENERKATDCKMPKDILEIFNTKSKKCEYLQSNIESTEKKDEEPFLTEIIEEEKNYDYYNEDEKFNSF